MIVAQRLKLQPRNFLSFTKCLSNNFSVGKGGKSGITKDVPAEYFDDSMEDDKEFFDIVASLKKDKSLRSMPTLHKPVKTWDQYAAAAAAAAAVPQQTTATQVTSASPATASSTTADSATSSAVTTTADQDSVIVAALQEAAGVVTKPKDVGVVEETMLEATFDETLRTGGGVSSSGATVSRNVAVAAGVRTGEITSHFMEAGGASPYIPATEYNYSIPSYTPTDETTTSFLDHFTPNTAPEKYPMHAQGLRACEGKAQRHGRSLELRCHLIDLDALSVLDVPTLKRFMTDDGEILGRRITGLCAKCQRKVARTVKHARNMGMLPHLGQFILRDAKPEVRPSSFHDVVKVTVTKHNVKTGKDEVTAAAVDKIMSKTIVV